MRAETKWIDEDGFTRKKRQWCGLFFMFLYGALGNTVKSSSNFVENLIPLLIAAGLFYLGITMVSSHDIKTWKHQKHIGLYIYVGCVFMALPGILVYYFLKGREKKFLKRQKREVQEV
jgi:threonine/homoserine/homoserine lactone efflux protein